MIRAGSYPSKRSRFPALVMAVALVACLIAAYGAVTAAAPGARAGSAQPAASLWPKFSTPETVQVADTTGLSGADLLTATTLEGIYNAAQQPSRLYLIQRAQDQFWLNQLPGSVKVSEIPPPSQGSMLQDLLQRFRPFIDGAVETDPSNVDTVNLATTMAGLDHAVVISPSQEPLAASLGIPVLYSFNTPGFTADTPAQTYQWGVQNLLPQSSTRLLVALSGKDNGDIRDYAAATGAFVFYLTSTDATQKPVLHTIIGHTPANTPMMGYVPNENPDVADLSSLGHFLTGSNGVTNESVWASMPSPSVLRQEPQAAPLAARPGTVYVAFMVSDGDNASYMQQRMPAIWQGADMGAVPAGWTVAPGAVDFDPPMLRYFSKHLPANSELDAGPSGIGYTSQMTGPDLTQFSQLTRDVMARDGLSTVYTYEPVPDLSQYAEAGNPLAIVKNAPLAQEQFGTTVASGTTSGYINTLQPLFCTIQQQAAAEQPGAPPMFLEPLINGYVYNGTDMLHIAQQLATAAKASGTNIVFTTPTELAETMQRYGNGQEAGLLPANAESVTGAKVLTRPLVSPSWPYSPPQVSGSNLVTNPSGASGTTGWSGGSVSATTYQGGPALLWNSNVTTGQSWVRYYPAVTNGQTYTFSAEVAGSGQVFMDVYNGAADQMTRPVQLGSAYQKLSWTVTIPANAPTGQAGNAPQLQIREVGAGPVSAYIRNASVMASTPAC